MSQTKAPIMRDNSSNILLYCYLGSWKRDLEREIGFYISVLIGRSSGFGRVLYLESEDYDSSKCASFSYGFYTRPKLIWCLNADIRIRYLFRIWV